MTKLMSYLAVPAIALSVAYPSVAAAPQFQTVAPVAFTGNDLRAIPAAIQHARRGRRIMTGNIALSLGAAEAEAYARRAAARVRLGDAAGILQVDAARNFASARLQLAQSDLANAQAEVALFRALGGGWRTDAASR